MSRFFIFFTTNGKFHRVCVLFDSGQLIILVNSQTLTVYWITVSFLCVSWFSPRFCHSVLNVVEISPSLGGKYVSVWGGRRLQEAYKASEPLTSRRVCGNLLRLWNKLHFLLHEPQTGNTWWACLEYLSRTSMERCVIYFPFIYFFFKSLLD